jgi:hypothetical protein
LIFKVANATAQCRLFEVESRRSLSEAPVLGSSDNAAERTKIEIHIPTMCVVAGFE